MPRRVAILGILPISFHPLVPTGMRGGVSAQGNDRRATAQVISNASTQGGKTVKRNFVLMRNILN